MLGRYCHLWFGDRVVKVINRDTLDAGSCTLDQICDALEPDCYVINCMGVIPQRSSDGKIMITVNALFPRLLHIACKQKSCTLIHISTDCVFSGQRGNYIETDEHDAADLYGISKSIGESREYCVIRTSIIGEELANKKSLLEWVKASKGKQLFGYIDHHWNGVTCLQLAKTIESVIEQGLWLGVRHIFSEAISKHDLIALINRVYDLQVQVRPYPTETVNKTLATIYPLLKVPSLEQQLQELRDFDLN